MDEQPKYNRILGYTPESNRATFELAPDQFGSVAVINCANLSGKDPATPEYGKLSGGQWHSGRSIRVNPLGDQGQPVAASDAGKVYHRNCMWFDVEIDKQYLDENAVTHVDTILRGNISDNMVYATIWWPVSEGPPDFTRDYTVISPQEPPNPLPPCKDDQPDVECGPTVWIQTIESDDSDLDIPIAIKTYTKLVEETLGPGDIVISRTWDWELVYGDQNGQGIYNTTTINNIPTFVFNPTEQCRFIVQVHWNQNFAHTAIDREVALYVFKGDTDATRSYQDYIVKSPIVKMRNQPNPGPPAPGEPSQKGFKPASMSDFYTDPARKYLRLPITNTEIVMDIMSGTATVDPNDEYENAVFVDLVGDDAELKLHCGPGSEAWVMAPVDDGTYVGNFPYYIGERTQDPNDPFGPITENYILTLSGPGRYAIYGQGALLPRTEEIITWLELNNFPTADYEPLGVITQQSTAGMFENTKSLSNITSWQDILITTGKRMFANVTGDFFLPEYQIITDLTQTFINTPDFTGTQGGINTWIIDSATQAYQTFMDSTNFDGNIDDWNTGQVTTMYEMFANCVNYNQPLNSWDVSKVTTMFGMFRNCSVFDQPLNYWDTSKVENMGSMFESCSVYDQFIAVWDVSLISSKPPGFDTSTTTEWTDFEKPWWGAQDRPNSINYIILDIQHSQFDLITHGYTRLQVFNLNKVLTNNISVNTGDQVQRIYSATPVAVFGETVAMGFRNGKIRALMADLDFDTTPDLDYTNENRLHEINSWDIIDGTTMALGIPKGETESFINADTINADIDQHIELDSDKIAQIRNLVATDAVLGDNNDWRFLFDMCTGLTQGAFNWMGKLPNDLPENLHFGWENMPADRKVTLLQRVFAGCSNLPERSITQTWTYDIDPTQISLDGSFSFMPDSNNLSYIMHDIMQLTDKIDATRIHQGSVLTDLNLPSVTTKYVNLKQAYRYADLTNTKDNNQVANLEHECDNWSQAYMLATGTNTFVDAIHQNISIDDTVMDYEFAYSDVRPDIINDWDFTKTSDISCMFYKGIFPDIFDNVDLSNYNSKVDNQGDMPDANWKKQLAPENKPNAYCHHVFTGCRNNTQSMVNWQLPPPTPLKPHYRDILIPWWFAGCKDFNTDISSWTTSDPTYYFTDINNNPIYTLAEIKKLMSVVRVGTFALCENFNSNIDWYYPDATYLDLGYIGALSVMYTRGYFEEAGTNLSAEKTKVALQYNVNITADPEVSNPRLFDTALYGRNRPGSIWWRTFFGATNYNNGGSPLPTIKAEDMVETFRLSGIDQDVKIMKPWWGKGYYQGVFEDTTAWTAPRVIDFECQNRSDTPELENVYYHAIMAQRMFKNSTFMGSLGPGFKWFFFNVSNVNGCHFSKHGVNKEFMNWENYADLEELRSRKANNTLNQIQTDTVTDSFGEKPVYMGKVMHTTENGPARAPQGNLIDPETEFGDMLTYTIYQQNAGLTDMPLPPTQERYMSDYAIRPLWTIGKNNSGFYDYDPYSDVTWYEPNEVPEWELRDTPRTTLQRSRYGYWTYQDPRTPVEMSNLKEMFWGAVNYDQDLSNWITRWSPPSGAFIMPADAPGGEYWNPDPYYGGSRPEQTPKPQTTFNRRNELNITIQSDVPYGLVPGQSDAGSDDKRAYYGWNIETGKFEVGFKSSCPSVGQCQYEELGETTKNRNFGLYQDRFINHGGNDVSVVYYVVDLDDPNSLPSDAQSEPVYWPDETLPYEVLVRTMPADSLVTYILMITENGLNWSAVNSSSHPDTWNIGDKFIYTSNESLWPGHDFDQYYVRLLGSITDRNHTITEFPEVKPGLLLNGHQYNDYGNQRYPLPNNSYVGDRYKKAPGPEKSEMDYFYTDSYAMDLDSAPTYGEAGDRILLYHGIKTQPTDFATGATNFTNDKWPKWMVGYKSEAQSVSEIIQHFNNNNPRSVGDSRYITNYAYTHEPFSWPDGDIYRNGDY